MHIPSLIEKKRDGRELSTEEIEFLVSAYADGEIPDYQMSAWAMAVFFRGMTAWLGFARVQIPFEVPQRASGHTGWSFPTRMKLALTGISAFSWLPLQFVTIAGLLFFCFSVLFGVYTLVLQLAGRSVSGFATVILLLLIIGSLLMLSLGIIGEYLARIYEEVKRRPRFVIASSIEREAKSE